MRIIVADTSTLFPPPLVRVTKPVSLDSILVAGAAQPSSVTGSFAATYGRDA